MSIPAFIISMNALEISEQQRRDALAQRAEDQQERARTKAEANTATDIAFIRRVSAYAPDVTDRGRVNIRNANLTPATVLMNFWTDSKGDTSNYYSVVLSACSEGSVQIPKADQNRSVILAVWNDEHDLLWPFAANVNSKPIDPDGPEFGDSDGFTRLPVSYISTQVTPCA
ncbi:hypothetical protein AB0L65_20735 [Nonomuraea sp. NPDC052116]|uniref:hypothetical protein n=1 Tax=Nonomuraea sp. NPDC052116 TaxID=3155665 RepID=UPI0034233CE3